MPEAGPLALIRADIHSQPHRIKGVLTDSNMRKEVFGGIPNDEKKVVKAFVTQNGENALKTKPKVSASFLPHYSLPYPQVFHHFLFQGSSSLYCRFCGRSRTNRRDTKASWSLPRGLALLLLP
jgi:hypothetical protein